MNAVGTVIAAGVVAFGALGVRTYLGYHARPSAPRSSAVALAHLDHTPRHGGLVLMNGDTHFEVVLDRNGGYAVHFTDAVRAPLPASVASSVHIVVTPPGRPSETIQMQIDGTGTQWIGRGTMVDDPNAIVRVTYATPTDKPYWIDVPVSGWPGVIASTAQ